MDGRSTRWEGHGEAQRERIVQAALALIEEGAEAPSLVEIGRRAGLARSAVYRHFADKGSLDAAVQRRIFRDLASDLLPQLTLEGEPSHAWRRAIETYVGWAADHPLLHRRAVLDPTNGPLQAGLDAIADQVAVGIVAWFRSLGAVVTEADAATADPLVHGLVGAIFAAVRRWVDQGAQVPDRAHMIDLLVEATSAMIDVRLRSYGLTLEGSEQAR
ncbi:TetR/AcrR family transcriptional regulator [Nocardioides sp. Kera G14]|uniref:TetR/AcrR family transcriptional regulator n=1 Tax=Nocardioides sp. Kera G14 TaxID=2884264 RepID=UPI001D126D3F|nr:TetR/AcrR family transcriptional regulator [Nocardioides sp. Kera G14]UDY23510.1 TetR/AcrR family transcriptional regulator [Nocardioides sp. Kera G14]